MIDFEFDDKNLWGMVQAMSPKERVRLMKGAMRASARTIKRRAESLLLDRLDHVSNPTAMKRTIWTRVYNQVAGFRVTVAGSTHCYPAKQRELPLGRWLETGSKGERITRGTSLRPKRSRRGRLGAHRFLTDACEEMKASMSADLCENFKKQMIRVAKKYGCV